MTCRYARTHTIVCGMAWARPVGSSTPDNALYGTAWLCAALRVLWLARIWRASLPGAVYRIDRLGQGHT